MKPSAQFHTKLSVEQLDAVRWQLVALLAFYSAKYDSMTIVPAGTVTDFASVPRIPLAFWLFAGIGQAAAVIHDWLYGCGTVPRKVADDIFLEAMEACGVPTWRRIPMYWAVRAFGAGRYSKAG
ncbi:DUF1353 domain-containing protein [Massilia yuzhufengensis]|uniref:DUF1353 domain-containing protein n=1 Tax=Massilia yuzhufengensis TaxID=1164594 RepID=A0A1I1VM31_9BURK|nr:DUF1353 domain-containing protein [Massilia yuzhufengensis]SFD83108.1 Protein of unknown function [Massilia yuzhufengensis]